MKHAPNLHMFQSGVVARLWTLLGLASAGVYRDGGLSIAKGVAYSGLLSFFPILTTLAAILVQVRADEVSRTIARLLYDVVPPGTDEVVKMLFVVHGQRPTLLLVSAIALATWAASGAIISLMEGFRAVYHTPDTRSFVRERLLAMGLVFTSSLPVLGASALIVFGKRVENSAVEWIGLTGADADLKGWVLLGGMVLRFVVAFGAIVLAAVVLYYVGPERKQRFRQVVPGAMLATVLWLLATLAFGWYVRHVVNYNVLYGGVGAGLALLVWMYVLAVILLLGCEYNAEREKMRLRDAEII
jgi:membrane protein